MNAFPYTIYRGDTVTIDFTVTEDDVAFDLTGSTVKFMGKTAFGLTDAQATFEVTCTLTTPASGECSAELQVASVGTYLVELEYRKDSTILTLKQWEMEVSQDLRQGT